METKKIIPLIVYPQNNGYVNNLNPIINGTGQPEANIDLEIGGSSYSATVDQDGIWSIGITNALVDGQEYTLTAVQTEKAGSKSPATTVSFSVDTKALFQHSITMPSKDQFINNSTPNISGTGKSGATIVADISGSTYNTIVNQNGIWNIEVNNALNEGANTISVYQKDMGNISPAVVVSFIVDTVAPEMPLITQPAPMGYESSPMPVISGRGEPDAEVSIIVDGKEYKAKANINGDWNLEIANSLSDDVHMILAKQKDKAGNISPENISLFTVETTLPDVPVIYSPLNGEFLSDTTPVISGIGEANSRAEVNHNGRIYSSLISSDGKFDVKITDELPNGKHSFNVYQVDMAGNVSPSVGLTIIIDTIAPLAPVVLYPIDDGFVNATTFTIKGTAEPDATVELKLAGKNYNTKVSSDGRWCVLISDNLTSGQQYSIILNQLDMAKNISPSIRVKFFVDTNYLQAPSVIFPALNTAVSTEYPAIYGTGYAGSTVNANINNVIYTTKVAENGSWSILVNQRLPQGLNNISITQLDKGNTSPSADISFYVDTIAPVAPIFVQPIENAVVTDSNLLIRGIGEALSTIELKLDNQNYSIPVGNDGMFEAISENIANGIHTIIACQRDMAGNYSPSATINCVVDNIQASNYTKDGKPAIGTVSYNPPASVMTTSVIATLTTNKPVIINNIVGTVFSRVVTTNGVSSFDFVDLEDHFGSVDIGVTWIDDTVPIIDIQSNGNYFSADKIVNYYKAGASGLKSAMINGVAFESGRVVTAEGNYTVVVTDNAGNVATKSFTIDKTVPTVLGVQSNATYNTDVNLSYYDNISGIKDATLNGIKIASGTSIMENGQYKFVVSDFGDNMSEINFTIAK